MSPFAAVAVKAIGAAGVAALLSVGVVSAATPTPSPSKPTAAGTQQPSADRRAIRRAVIEAEADVLGIKPEELVKDLKAGQKVSDLAKAKGMTKEQFAARLIANLKPRLDALVDHKVITRAQADKVLDWLQTGHIPFWDGLRHRE